MLLQGGSLTQAILPLLHFKTLLLLLVKGGSLTLWEPFSRPLGVGSHTVQPKADAKSGHDKEVGGAGQAMRRAQSIIGTGVSGVSGTVCRTVICCLQKHQLELEREAGWLVKAQMQTGWVSECLKHLLVLNRLAG